MGRAIQIFRRISRRTAELQMTSGTRTQHKSDRQPLNFRKDEENSKNKKSPKASGAAQQTLKSHTEN